VIRRWRPSGPPKLCAQIKEIRGVLAFGSSVPAYLIEGSRNLHSKARCGVWKLGQLLDRVLIFS
jgi:hypothetical protein